MYYESKCMSYNLKHSMSVSVFANKFSVNKLLRKYGKRTVLTFYVHCVKFEESQSHNFAICS